MSTDDAKDIVPREEENLPSRALVGMRLQDAALLRDYAAGKSLSDMARDHGLGNPKKAAKALERALQRLDARIQGSRDAIRAGEFMHLQAISDALSPRMSNPKNASELRLLSESRRRMYGVDLDLKVEGQEPIVFVIDNTLPNDRKQLEDGGAEVEGEVIEIAEWTESHAPLEGPSDPRPEPQP